MRTFNATQTAIAAATNKQLYWLFTVVDTNPTTHYWSTVNKTFDGHDFLGKIDPKSFTGISLQRSKSGSGIISPNDLSFTMVDSGLSLDPADFIGATVTLQLVGNDYTNEAELLSWKFRIKRCESFYKTLKITCSDFIQEFLDGSSPKTPLIRDIFPSNDVAKKLDMCIPLFSGGDCFIPLPCVYAGSQRHYVLGNDSDDFIVDKLRSPRTGGAKSTWEDGWIKKAGVYKWGASGSGTNEYYCEAYAGGDPSLSEPNGVWIDSAKADEGTLGSLAAGEWGYGDNDTLGYSTVYVRLTGGGDPDSQDDGYVQSYVYNSIYPLLLKTVEGADEEDYKTLDPIIADANNDRVVDSTGLWLRGNQFLNPGCKFELSSGRNTPANPRWLIYDFLIDLGVDADDIDDTGGGTFTIYTESSDARLQKAGTTFANRNISPATDVSPTMGFGNGASISTSGLTVDRSAFPFDLSSLSGESGTVTAVSLFVHGQGIETPTSVAAFKGDFNIPVVTSDWPAYEGDEYGRVNWDTGDWNEIEFNSQGIQDVADTIGDTFKTTIIEAASDADDIEPITNHYNGLYLGGVGKIPYLKVTIEFSSFNTAWTQYNTWGLTFDGALWKREKSKPLLARLLNQCHSVLDISDKIELRALSKTSQKTLDSTDIVKKVINQAAGFQAGVGSFKYTASLPPSWDSGRILWQLDSEIQDDWLENIVTAKSGTDSPATETLLVDLVRDSQDVQRLGTLFFQRKLRNGNISFTAKSEHLNLQTGDIITVNDSLYGASKTCIIDSMKIKPSGCIDFKCSTFSVALDDFDDLAPAAIVPETDDTSLYDAWMESFSGPRSEEAVGIIYNMFSGMADAPMIVISPIANKGQFLNLKDALQYVEDAGLTSARIFAKNGTYAALDGKINVPNVPLIIEGESRDGVVFKNKKNTIFLEWDGGSTQTLIKDATLDSQNDYSSSTNYSLLNVHNSTPASTQTTKLYLINCVFDCINYNDNFGDIVITTLDGEGENIISIIDCHVTGVCSRFVSAGSVNAGFLEIRNTKVDKCVKTCIDADCDNILIDGFIQRDGNYIGILAESASLCKIVNSEITLNSYTADRKIGIKVDAATTRATISGNNISITSDVTNVDDTIGIILNTGDAIICSLNNIEMNLGTSDNFDCYGIVGRTDLATLTGNVIKIDRDNSAGTPSKDNWGIYIDGDRNSINNSTIDMVNDTAQDIGIELSSSTNYCQANDNITYNCGTSIDDNGTNNTLTNNKDT